MSYKQEHYNEIFKHIQEKYSLSNEDIPKHIWIAWRVSIKRMFDEGILISEIIGALPEAEMKGHWPHGTAFWHRVKDVVLKNRHYARKAVKVDEGMQSLASLMQGR
jgi:hypothetical protein